MEKMEKEIIRLRDELDTVRAQENVVLCGLKENNSLTAIKLPPRGNNRSPLSVVKMGTQLRRGEALAENSNVPSSEEFSLKGPSQAQTPFFFRHSQASSHGKRQQDWTGYHMISARRRSLKTQVVLTTGQEEVEINLDAPSALGLSPDSLDSSSYKGQSCKTARVASARGDVKSRQGLNKSMTNLTGGERSHRVIEARQKKSLNHINPVIALPEYKTLNRERKPHQQESSCLIQTERTLKLYDQIKQYASAHAPKRTPRAVER